MTHQNTDTAFQDWINQIVGNGVPNSNSVPIFTESDHDKAANKARLDQLGTIIENMTEIAGVYTAMLADSLGDQS